MIAAALARVSRLYSGPATTPLDATDTFVVRIYTLDLILVVLTQKLAFPLGGRESQITAAFLIHFALMGLLAMRGYIRIGATRLLLFCALATWIGLTQIPNVSLSFSLPSMILMLATGFMLVLTAPISAHAYRVLMNRFVLVTLAVSALVGLDWAVQAAGFAMPDIESLMPRALVYYEYVYIQPLQWGSPWMKPNGVFFLETSHVSQFIATGLVLELALFRRYAIALALGGALLSTFGITGVLLFATSAPFLLVRLRRAAIVAVAGLALVGGLAASQSSLLDSVLKRTGEFSQSSSSGYNRFVLPLHWSATALMGPPDKAWFGTGAGSMPKAINDEAAGTAGYAWPPYTKVGVEYGAIALAIWLLFIADSLIVSGIPLIVSWVAFAQYNFLNGSLNVPIHTIYCVLLCAGYAVAESKTAKSPWRAMLPRRAGAELSTPRGIT